VNSGGEKGVDEERAGSAPFPSDGEILQSLSRCHESLAESVLS